ncbi:inositol hexakisphosphate and diphosphoinositol-pentakisphosphate kinase 1 isoform X11 [Canis lupus baileyi]|uniref:Inositol hexakisphosphate and diphosphoinositol-pentakisphosphate kinase n=1 Tax=Canis lupus familiaris TaxID=9615 RepID=A0A8C0Z1Y1_CANLF|nr:inositol hexakisphosphate and diphosphoinositol-pentakisphosphate kinase 1 isoform X8 [Canis lupus familiaris]XP_038317017.1 inositol hexakisphosphate and diphosphoinositol-pentakisphosphate kinase 1 isoform X8 [Canis lupus familiaris]XP_038436159.1 inositol hexakisphosphate and diphosphoinositol-pentakisphosphate kinase 1 isoform X8 [Canis lupus familiaris]XP_048960222.1 inositol hexakisphosphate and diphosphoinositol-pentakisphosphate kinase 1 isoform X11 [Canis lupus dingo]
MWSLPASEGESATAHFFLGAGDEGLGTRGIGMRTEESDNELLEDEEDEVPPEPQIIVGICAMTKKSKSKPMTQILERLCRFDYLTVIILGEDVILNEPVENWPSCHCLISFHSKGFPLDKAVAYSKLRNPFLINDLAMQYYIQDRREVYRILQEEGIDLPRYAVLNRDPARPEECNLIEGEDQVEVNGAVFPKPFVEKPVSAEDHNVYIYYPSSAGGGSQRLFRKIGSRSSVYSPESSVRKTGSYIYEEFMPTDGTDVKVYTVGPDYAHAEARKSPALDGKVERDSEGKEIRYPVMLTAMEKLVARKVCVAFKQTVCGFDLLRANGHSFVCDVNGFSFVKNSMKYYDDCAKILGNTIMRELAPQFQIPWSIPTEAEDIPIVPTTSGTMMELRCVIAIIRHGDRTPKQKMKMEVTHPRFFSLFEKHGGYKTGKLKLKRPEQLQEVLDITRLLLAELEKEPGGEIEEKTGKLEQLKSVLEMYGHFSGINRKVQLTYYPHGVKATNEGQDPQREALAPSLLLVLKWGGELTPAGRVQAEELGRAFRCMYPGGQGDYAGFPGCGLLRLHSTFRHDLKIYASDEGRVQMTAAAFAKGLLALEGELTPILVQMVKSANMNGLLDSDGDSLSSCQHRVKARLHHILQQDAPFGPEDYDQLAPTGSTSLLNSMAVIQNPVKVCDQVFALIENLTHQIRERMQDPKSVDLQLYHSETLELMLQRWSKLERDFRQKSGRYDISKIPDIYDCVKYDVQHNGSLGLQGTAELLRLSKALADVVIPQEYGISREEKLEIAVGFCLPLLRKILLDLQRTHEDESVNKLHPLYSRGVLSPGRHVRTRLYFTSESHVHSLLSVFRYGGLLDETQDAQWQRALAYLSAISELNYMTQIVIMLYEDNTRDPLSEERFHVELHFSPGVKGVEEEGSAPTGCGFRPASSENEEMKTDQGSMENLCPGKASDEPDRALQTSPQPLEGPGLPRRSPLIRNRKAGSMEVMNMQCTGNLDLIPLRGRRRRRSGDLPRPSPAIGLQPRAVSTTHLASCTQVLSETSSSRPGSYRLFSSARPPTEMKQSGLGFEGCSMVPTIYPLETLHNALSLRQVSEFLSRVCQRHTDAQAQASAALFDSMHSNQASDSPFSPPRTLHSPTLQLRQRSEKPPWYSSGPSSTVSSAGPSSPTAVDGNCPFGFSDQPSVSSHMIEEHQGLGMLPRNGEQELPIEGVQEPFEPSQSSQEPPVETSQPCQEVVEEISQPCQEVPDISQPCQDIPEEVSQPCQEVPDIGQPCQENHDSVNQICQEVPQIHQPCQKASQLCQKMSEDACQLCQKNPEKVSQPSLDVPVEVGRLAHGFPVGVRDLVQEIHVEVGRPAQETPEEFSQPCQEFFVEVGRLAQEASAINLLSQDIPEVDKPSQEFPGEDDLQVQEVPEINQQSWVVPEVIDQLPGEDIPQAQYLSSDPNPQSQSLAHDQYSPLPPATCD